MFLPVGSRFYNKTVDNMVKLPKNVRIRLQRIEDDHVTLVVFSPALNKGLNRQKMFVPAEFNLKTRSFIPIN